MQHDPQLYDRMHSEISIYSYRYPERFNAWKAVAIYPSRTVVQSQTKVPQELFESGRIMPVYLDELGAIAELPPGLGLMVLTTLEGEAAIAEAKGMVDRARQTIDENVIMSMVSSILVNKFKTLSRDEVNVMLGYTTDELKQTRFYRDVREDERREIVLMQLNRKVGQLSPQNQARVEALGFDRLQVLGADLLDFTNLTDLENWLEV
jgi:predicted transposase YdaD